jgi:hypothetical protein
MVIHTYIKEKKDEQLNRTCTTEQSRAKRNMRLLYRGSRNSIVDDAIWWLGRKKSGSSAH